MPRIGTIKGKQDPFKDIDSDWRDRIAAMSAEEINGEIAKVAKDQEALDAAKDADDDLASLKEQVKVAMEPYNDGRKANRLKIRYAIQVLGDKGGE